MYWKNLKDTDKVVKHFSGKGISYKFNGALVHWQATDNVREVFDRLDQLTEFAHYDGKKTDWRAEHLTNYFWGEKS